MGKTIKGEEKRSEAVKMSEKVNSVQSVQDQCGASVILAAASVIVGNSTPSHIVLHRNSSPLVHVFWQTFGFSIAFCCFQLKIDGISISEYL